MDAAQRPNTLLLRHYHFTLHNTEKQAYIVLKIPENVDIDVDLPTNT